MPILPVTQHAWLPVPPLDMPLALRLENGRFDSLRPKPLPAAPACATTQVLPADDPVNPTGEEVHFATGIHQAVDLASVAGNCVYAASNGRVVGVEANPRTDRGNVSIDHHPEGQGFLTNYNHVTEIRVEVGDFVTEGEPFAQVSSEPEAPHLHFELRALVDPDAARGAGPPGDTQMVPLDPTRALYAWEQRLVPDEPLPGPEAPRSVGVTRLHTIPFFVASFESGLRLHVPLYEPMTEDERELVRLLREAHARGAGLEMAVRASAFWGVDVLTQAVVT